MNSKRRVSFYRQIVCVAWTGRLATWLLTPFLLLSGAAAFAVDKPEAKLPRIAAVVTEYRHNSHADVIVSRLLQGYHLNGEGGSPRLKLVSLYTDQVPKSDTSRALAKEHGFKIYETVAGALTRGGKSLDVDGVLLVAEHGKYPKSETGQTIYPKRRLMEEIVEVFRASGRVVPVFSDKHLADNWKDAEWIYKTSREMKFPMMAGSSIPVLWRYPPTDVKKDAGLKEIVAVSYHSLDGYGFHAMEMVQCLAEQRTGGETGVKSVLCLEGDAVWQAEAAGRYDRRLLDAALGRLKSPRFKDREDLKRRVKNPVLFVINYRDGLKASVLTLNGAVGEWSAAWRYADDDAMDSALFWTQEARPYNHFSYLVRGVDEMMQTGKPTWPVERTLLTSGALDALLISKQTHRPLETPWLDVRYQSNWRWKQPPPPPPGRASGAQ